jgi:hypothetical protein
MKKRRFRGMSKWEKQSGTSTVLGKTGMLINPTLANLLSPDEGLAHVRSDDEVALRVTETISVPY